MAGRRGIGILGLGLWLVFLSGCPPSPKATALTAEAVRYTLDSWNPTYCKVVEFYGFYYSEARPPHQACVAFVLLANPADADKKLVIYEARFKQLVKANGQTQWYLTGLISHSAGLSRRQGWDNLLIPVRTPASKTSS